MPERARKWLSHHGDKRRSKPCRSKADSGGKREPWIVNQSREVQSWDPIQFYWTLDFLIWRTLRTSPEIWQEIATCPESFRSQWQSELEFRIPAFLPSIWWFSTWAKTLRLKEGFKDIREIQWEIIYKSKFSCRYTKYCTQMFIMTFQQLKTTHIP